MPREIKVEIHLTKRTEALGGLCIKLNPLWYTGIPDRMLLLPDSRIIFVETKRPKTEGGRYGKKQRWWKAVLTRLGFRCVTLWSVPEVDDFFELAL